MGTQSVREAPGQTLELLGVADTVDGMAAANAEATAALRSQVYAMRAERDASVGGRDGAVGEFDCI